MNYATVFEVGSNPVTQQTGVIYTLAAMAGVLAILSVLRFWKGKKYSTKTFGVVGAAAGLFSLLMVATVVTRDGYDNKILELPVHVIEGVVEDFNAMSYAGHGVESLSVAGVRFEYSDYVINGGYNKTVSHGGELVPGAYARVTYVERENGDRVITKVEIREPEPAE